MVKVNGKGEEMVKVEKKFGAWATKVTEKCKQHILSVISKFFKGWYELIEKSVTPLCNSCMSLPSFQDT